MADDARLLAFEAFDAVLRQGSYSNLVLKKSQKILNEQDRAFSAALFYGSLEKLITLDYILEKHIKKSAKPVIKNILRMGAYQIHFMDSVPDHAAVKTSCDIAKKLGKEGAVSFINGVLRNVARDKDNFTLPKNTDETKTLSVIYSFPEWLIEKWTKELGYDETLKLISYQRENTVTIHANSLKGMGDDELRLYFEKNNIEYKKSDFVPSVFKVKGNILNTEAFKNGEIALQGEASYLASMTAVHNSPQTVLDLCAAPGGKTAAMAHLNNSAQYTACDIMPHRVEIMHKQFARLGVEAKTYVMDATVKNNDIGQFDSVLCDVPCSALGTVFDHPEVKYNKTEEQMKEIVEVQKKIIENAADYVKPGGYLTYSTCTISQRENHDMVEEFLKNHDEFTPVFPKTFYGIINDKRFDGCGVQLLPHKDNTAGFYIACLKKD